MNKSKTFFEFKPSEYLSHYYDTIGDENDFLIRTLADVYKLIKRKRTLLIFGSGPTIYSAIPAANKVKEIIFADYLSDNLNEVKKWISKHPQAFNWNPYITRSLEYEGRRSTPGYKNRRHNLIVKKSNSFIFCDATREAPLEVDNNKKFDIIQMDFVAESITNSIDDFRKIISNVTALIKKNGYFSMFALKKAEHYLINNKKYPAVPVDRETLRPIFDSLGLNIIMYDEVKAERRDGYEGIMYFLCRKK